jgi:hypothetical protein
MHPHLLTSGSSWDNRQTVSVFLCEDIYVLIFHVQVLRISPVAL